MAHAAILSGAAGGDLACQRALADEAYQTARQGGPFAPHAYLEAITFARLAAMHGELRDQTVIVFLMAEFAGWLAAGSGEELALSTYWGGQALHVAEAFAEDGNDELADMVASGCQELPRAAHEAALRMRRGEPICTAL